MKKITVLLILCVLLIVPFSICASAANLADGTYEVPVTLMHKEDEKESFGNKYVASTALLKVEGSKKTVTILLTTDMNGIEFSYYKNGSLDGDTADGTLVSNVTVAGETYERGYEIPVMTDGDIGLKFSVPVMPMSPSARLRIDYDNAVLISAQETTTAEQTTVASTTSVSATATENVASTAVSANDNAEQTTVIAEQTTAVQSTETTVPETVAIMTGSTENNGDNSVYIYVGLFLGAVVISAIFIITDDITRRKAED